MSEIKDESLCADAAASSSNSSLYAACARDCHCLYARKIAVCTTYFPRANVLDVVSRYRLIWLICPTGKVVEQQSHDFSRCLPPFSHVEPAFVPGKCSIELIADLIVKKYACSCMTSKTVPQAYMDQSLTNPVTGKNVDLLYDGQTLFIWFVDAATRKQPKQHVYVDV